MTSKWKTGVLRDLIAPTNPELAENHWEYELITVRLHARGLVNSARKPNKTKSSRKHYFRRTGQILIGRQNFHRQCVGLVTDELDGLVTSNAISAFVPKDNVLLDYALYVLQSPDIAEIADLLMPGTGQREISVKTLMSIPVAIPPLQEQRRIVDLIGALDDAIDAAEKKSQSSAELLKGLQDKSPSGEIVSLGSVLSGIIGGVSSKESNNPNNKINVGILKVSAVRSALFQPNEVKWLGDIPVSERARVSNGDLLMTRSNTPQTVGQVCLVEDVQDTCYLPDLIWRLEPVPGIVIPGFLSHYLSSSLMRASITGIATGTSPSMRKVNKASVSSLKIELPDIAEQQRYMEQCDLAAKGLAATKKLKSSLIALRSEILTDLLTGSHEIPESYDSSILLTDR